MAIEAKRGCGYRKIGGLYLMGLGKGMPCDRLPLLLTVCPCCGNGIKQSRGWTWIDLGKLTGGVHQGCADEFPCPLCMDTDRMGRAGLLWIGEKFYRTPESFLHEAEAMGISKRISAIPHDFELGKTWVILAHPLTIDCSRCRACGLLPAGDDPFELGKAMLTGAKVETKPCPDCEGKGKLPGAFRIFRPHAIEKLLPESKRDSQEAADLVKRGITVVFVPDDDPDHQGTVYDDEANGTEADSARAGSPAG